MNNETQWGFDSEYNNKETIGSYTAKTFMWMFFGLMVTFITCIALYTTGMVYQIYSIPGLHLILLFGQLFLVVKLSRNVFNLSVGKARTIFFIYAASNGILFSGILLAYNLTSVIFVFGLTSLYFGGMSLFGYFTKVDLSRLRPILISGVIFLIVVNLASIFLDFSRYDSIICTIGIIVFLAFTAYDVQKIRYFYERFSHDKEQLSRASIYFALQLYLDFINLFMYLLRFLGNRRG